MNLEDIIDQFHTLLQKAWPALPEAAHDQCSGLPEWLQATWEAFVEYPISYEVLNRGCRLQPYWVGSDWTGNSLNVFHPEREQSHTIKVNGIYEFSSFGTLINGQYKLANPFDYVCAVDEEGNQNYIKYSDVEFTIEKI